jgi:hypothetical protein
MQDRTTRPLRSARRALVIAAGLLTTFAMVAPASAAEAPVGLGTAGSFAVIGGSTVTNTGPSVISGDVGLSPGSSVTGFPPGIVNNGVTHVANGEANQAQSDLVTAYNDAAGRAPTASVSADLGGQTLVGGVYVGSTLGITGTLTLDAQGDPDTVFIFQVASTLITASSSSVSLIGGAQACNVYWQVGSSATLGTGSAFVGTVMALTSVTANTGATIQGRLLARNGAVTLDTNTINRPSCAAPTTTTTTGGTTTDTTGSDGTTGTTGSDGTTGTTGSDGTTTVTGNTGDRTTATGNTGDRTTTGGTGSRTTTGSLAYTGTALTLTAIAGGVALLAGALMYRMTRQPADANR